MDEQLGAGKADLGGFRQVGVGIPVAGQLAGAEVEQPANADRRIAPDPHRHGKLFAGDVETVDRDTVGVAVESEGFPDTPGAERCLENFAGCATAALRRY